MTSHTEEVIMRFILLFCLTLLFNIGFSPRSALADIVRLQGGTEVHGHILKRTQQRIWIDIGPEVIAIGMDQIIDLLHESSDANDESVDKTQLFRTSTRLPELSPREQAKRVGASVIKVSTPGAIGSGVLLNEADVRLLGWENPVGKQLFTMDSASYTVIIS